MKRKRTLKSYAAKVVKKVIISGDSGSELKKAFLAEVRIMRMTTHKNILRLHEIHETRSEVVLILELIRGPNISHLHSLGQPLHEIELTSIMRDVLLILKTLHSNGIIHRDISPPKLLLLKKGSPCPLNPVILVGFSSCSFYASDKIPSDTGTYGFIAPECLRDIPAANKLANQPSRDLWSLGSLIFYMATKHYPLKKELGRKI